MAETWSPEQVDRYDKMLVLEAANELPPDALEKLNALRKAGEVPPLPAWQPDHPHILAAEQKYQLPKGSLSALMGGIENPEGLNDAESPTYVKGLFQVTVPTGAPYGLNKLNRTNPYLNTDVAARHLKDLLAASNGNLAEALKRYKGPEISDEAYLAKYEKAFQQYAGVPLSQATAGITPTAPTAPPLDATATTITRTTPPGWAGTVNTDAARPVGAAFASRVGANDTDPRRGANIGEAASAALNLPWAALGTAVERATGSRTEGSVAQNLPLLLLGVAAARTGISGLRSLLPRGRAATELAAVRTGAEQAAQRARMLSESSEAAKAEAGRLTATRLPAQVERATTGAQEVAQQAGEDLARQGSQAPIPRRLTRRLDELDANPSGRTPGTPVRTETSPLVDEFGRPITREIPATPGRKLRPITERDVPPDLAAARQAVQQMGSRVTDFQKIVERVSAPGVSPASKLRLLEEGNNIIRRDIPGLEDAVATRLLIEETLANATKLREAAKAAGASGGDLAKRAAELERFLASESVTKYLARKGMQITKAGIVVDVYRRLSSGPRSKDE